MQRTTPLIAALLLAGTPLIAQQPTNLQPQQTTTSINRGDQNTSINANATGQNQQTTTSGSSSQIREPALPRDVNFNQGRTRATGTTSAAPRVDRTPTVSPQEREQMAANSDVYLEVPNLSVDQILLDVDNVQVHLALDARVANLVSLKAGADAGIGRVKLEIRGVQAEAYLVVRLDNVAKILDRTLTTIDKNPEILNKLIGTVNNAVGTVGNVANTALQPGGVVSQTVGAVGQTLNNVTQPGGVLTQTVNTLGQTVTRTLDTTGNIVDKTLDTTGKVVNQTVVPVVNQTTNTAGQIVKQVRDATGQVIEYTFDKTGNIISSKVISAATNAVPRR